MKILKSIILVLLVSLTFSFNSKENNGDDYQENTMIREKKVRIYFLPGLNESQKTEGRNWASANYHIYLVNKTEETASYETWTYMTEPGTTNVNNHSDTEDGEIPFPEMPGGEYVSVQFNFSTSAPTFTHN